MGAMSRYVDWLNEARDDLESANYLLEGGRYSKACFYAQQSAEKAVKALLIKRFGRYEEVHSVADLLKIIKDFIHVDESMISMGNKLDGFYIPTRYPNAWPSGAPHERYVKSDAEEAVAYASAIFEFVKDNVK